MKHIAERTGRHCLSLPSNRLGLYLALRHWCAPGQRLLMSPVSADEILFLVLAAGLRPVMAPLSPVTATSTRRGWTSARWTPS
ncbi:hypothetical protein ACFQYP_63810 [Nonomuraea antimicrobica]